MELVEVVTVDYSKDYAMLYAEGREPVDCRAIFIDLFERTMTDVLRGTDRDNVGGVLVYYRAGDPVAWFDYENMWGGRYE